MDAMGITALDMMEKNISKHMDRVRHFIPMVTYRFVFTGTKILMMLDIPTRVENDPNEFDPNPCSARK